jgi:ribonuclease E
MNDRATPGDSGEVRSGAPSGGSSSPDSGGSEGGGNSANANRNRRRRGSRGGKNRNRNTQGGANASSEDTQRPAKGQSTGQSRGGQQSSGGQSRGAGGKPKIGDTRPALVADGDGGSSNADGGGGNNAGSGNSRKRRLRRGRGGGGERSQQPVDALISDVPVELDDDVLEMRKGAERKGQPVGRYTMVVHRGARSTQIAILEGRVLIEHYVAFPADDVSQIHGNVYLGKVQNVLPGMEAAFVDIATPKNAVLYRGDLTFDKHDVEKGSGPPRIEQVLKNRQNILCQVTKNPIAHKGARLTQEVSLPGRFVVLVPNSDTYGISKRLPDKERKRLRNILDRAKPKHHGVIVRTAAENVTAEEIERDVARLLTQWEGIEKLSKSAKSPSLLYREPEMAMRVIREEFSKEYRSVIIDDEQLYGEVSDYVTSITPALADRVQFHDTEKESLSLFEQFHVAEQLVKALDKKVWLPSGGSLIIEHTEALTVIDVNTGKNVGRSSLEETVYRNNLEAAKEVARQLRLRDIGGIIVIDFVDMEERRNREDVTRTFREALARDKTRTQVFDISDLGLVEMTRKRIGEGLLESFSTSCEKCNGLGHDIDQDLLTDV